MEKHKLLALYDLASRLADEKGISHREAIQIVTKQWNVMERGIELFLLLGALDKATEEVKRGLFQFLTTRRRWQ